MNAFAIALAGLATTLGQPLSTAQIDGYCSTLSHLDEDHLIQACGVFSRSVKWVPKPCEFIDLLERGEIVGDDPRAEAARAWAALQAVVSNSSRVEAMCAADARVRAGVDALGGWFTMLNGGEDPKWQRRTFVDAFCGESQHQRRQAIGAGPAALPLGTGSSAASNQLPPAMKRLADQADTAPQKRRASGPASLGAILGGNS